MDKLTDEQYEEFVLFYRSEMEKKLGDDLLYEGDDMTERDDWYESPWEDAARMAYLFHEYLKQKGL